MTNTLDKSSMQKQKYIKISKSNHYNKSNFISDTFNVEVGLLLHLIMDDAENGTIQELEVGCYQLVWEDGEDQDNGHGDIYHIAGYYDFKKVEEPELNEDIEWWDNGEDYTDSTPKLTVISKHEVEE